MSIKLPSRMLVAQPDAAEIDNAKIPRSRFENQWTRKTAFDAGVLVPLLVDEILPGDHMKYDVTAYLRMSTPLFPIFDEQRVDTFFFFVPSRLLWTNWVRMFGEQDTPLSSIAFTTPQVVSPVAGFTLGSIYDHFGIPGVGQITAGQTISVNALPLRAYNLIINEWFRDQNLTGKFPQNVGDGPDANTDYVLVTRGKSHDYFTSALPWPQKFTAPTIPLTGLAPITGFGAASNFSLAGPINSVESDNTTHSYPKYRRINDAGGVGQQSFINMVTGAGGLDWPAIYADLSLNGVSLSVTFLRQAMLIQQLLERDARGGTRYTEMIRSQWGVVNPDFRLQRPEYIGGGQSPLQITPIAQTAPTAGVPLGAIGGAGTSAGRHQASYAATEHGFVIGLINIKSELSYQQGLHPLWSRQTRYDYYVPALAGLSEQAIPQRQIYVTGVALADTTTFGYQERWHEYRTRWSDVTGIMRSTATGTLDAWHLAQKFTAAPVLNTAFIGDTPPMSRILAAGALANGQQYLANIHYHRTAVRPIPMFGTPAQLGRF